MGGGALGHRRERGARAVPHRRARVRASRTGGWAAVCACDVDLFVLVSYGHYDYAQVNNFQRTQLARYVAHECIQDWHACAAA